MTRDHELALVGRARSDREAFDRLFGRYADRILGWARRRSASAREAEALTEQVLERAFGALGRFDGAVPLDVWIFAHCKAALASARKSSQPESTGAPAGVRSGGDSPAP